MIGRETLRHTPAGVPVLVLTLRHESNQLEAGIRRHVGFELEAMALGEVAQRLECLEAGSAVQVTGFLAARSKLSTRVVLHINEFETQ